MKPASYDPENWVSLTFHDAAIAFARGADDPVAYLERCLGTIAEREPEVKAWKATRFDAAREEAAASAMRWKSGTPLSPIDGMPVSIKDLIETRDLPTGLGIAGYDGATNGIDSACVQALRDAGAIIMGKVVTTELGGTHPGETTNPFDPLRTPGGSSSGSAASVGANMVPVSIGTQVGGSILRPAGYCANVALKPTFGAIHRGERQGYSQSCHGIHANAIEDMWTVAIEIATRTGGDPGHPGLFGAAEPPVAVMPARLIVMESAGWAVTDDKTRGGFEAVLDQLRAKGVRVLRRQDHPFIEEFEESIADALPIVAGFLAYENRWLLRNLVRLHPGQLSESPIRQLETALNMSVNDYRRLLRLRSHAQRLHARLAPLADAIISPTTPGPAPLISPSNDQTGVQRLLPTGDPSYSLPTSMLWAPTVQIPMMAVGGMPVGMQIMGQLHEDYRMAGYARWILGSLKRVAV